MSQPPYDPYRGQQPQQDPYRPAGGGTPYPQDPYAPGQGGQGRYGDQGGYDGGYGEYGGGRGGYGGERGGYGGGRGEHGGQGASRHGQADRVSHAAPPRHEQPRPAPERAREPRRSPRRVLGIGLVLAILGTLVHLLSVTVLPWVEENGGDLSLSGIWGNLTDGGAAGFGDWYVVLFSYPLVALGILLAFAAVLESVAMKVVWGGLMLLGLGYLVLRYGLGPLTGLAGEEQVSTTQIVLACVALAAVVLVVFVLKMAVSTFRRIAGLILIGLSGVHITAVTDLVGTADFSDLSVGAFGPSVGYLLIGAAALIGPRRFIPGL